MQLRSLKDKSVGIVFMTEFQKVKSNPVQHRIFLWIFFPLEAIFYWKKKEKRSNIWHEIPLELSLCQRPAYQILPKVFDISSATARVVPDLLKALAILSDTVIRRSAVDWDNLKIILELRKKATFLQVINNSIIYKF